MIITAFKIIFYIIFSLWGGIGAQMMGYAMPPYPVFLLYGTGVGVVLIFATASLLLKESWKLDWIEWILTIILGILATVNGIFAQTAIPFVAPEITALLAQSATPVMWIFTPILVGKRGVFVLDIIAFATISTGLIFGSLVSFIFGSGSLHDFENSPFWLIITILGILPLAFMNIIEEYLFKRNKKCPKFMILTIVNIITVILYILWIPSTMVGKFGTCQTFPDKCDHDLRPCHFEEMFIHQLNSTKCFMGYPNIKCCRSDATYWNVIYIVGTGLSSIIAAYILEKEGSNLIANITALMYPLGGMALWFKIIAREDSSTFKWWILITMVVITIGNIIYMINSIKWFKKINYQIIGKHRGLLNVILFVKLPNTKQNNYQVIINDKSDYETI